MENYNNNRTLYISNLNERVPIKGRFIETFLNTFDKKNRTSKSSTRRVFTLRQSRGYLCV